MPWIISGFMCLGLVLVIGAVLLPDLVIPTLAKVWEIGAYYFRHK